MLAQPTPPLMPATLSPAQREILHLLRHDLPEETWDEIRQAVASILFRRLTDEADRVWEEKGWTDEDAERMLHAHYRRSSDNARTDL